MTDANLHPQEAGWAEVMDGGLPRLPDRVSQHTRAESDLLGSTASLLLMRCFERLATTVVQGCEAIGD
jgi:hypothetical protein